MFDYIYDCEFFLNWQTNKQKKKKKKQEKRKEKKKKERKRRRFLCKKKRVKRWGIGKGDNEEEKKK